MSQVPVRVSKVRGTLPWVLIGLFVAFAATSATGAAPVSVAVVDVMTLLKEHPRRKEIDELYEKRRTQARDFAKNENTRLEQMDGEIKLMTPANPGRRQKEKELAAAMVTLKFELEWREKDAEREYIRGLESLYANVQLMTSKYAREQGIQVVLKKDDPEIRGGDVTDWSVKVQLRSVVFSDTVLDITEKVRPLLVATSAPGTAAPGGSPPPGPPASPPPAGPGSVPPGGGAVPPGGQPPPAPPPPKVR